MIGSALSLLMLGLLGVAAFYAIVMAGALICAPVYWGHRFLRFAALALWRAGDDLWRPLPCAGRTTAIPV